MCRFFFALLNMMMELLTFFRFANIVANYKLIITTNIFSVLVISFFCRIYVCECVTSFPKNKTATKLNKSKERDSEKKSTQNCLACLIFVLITN